MTASSARTLPSLLTALLLGLACAGPYGLAEQDTAQSTAPPDVLTVDNAVKIGLANNRTLKIVSLNLGVQDEKLAADKTKRLPSFTSYIFGSQLLTPISYTIPAGQFGANTPIGPIPATNSYITTPAHPTALVALTASQPLLSLYRINLYLRGQQLSVEEAKEQLREQRLTVIDPVLRYVTSWVGGGSPRFWFSLSPQARQLNYAQVLVELTDKQATPQFVNQVQPILTASLPGVRADYRQLQTNPVNYPIEIRISNQADVSSTASAADIGTLRGIARQVEDILNSTAEARRVRNEWQAESSQVTLKIDPDRANLAGVTNYDVANSATGALSGVTVTTLQEGHKNIPVVARLRGDERAQLSDIQNLYVYASATNTKIPLVEISAIQGSLQNERIIRLDHFRTISVYAFPAGGHLASEVLSAALPKLRELQNTMPPGYTLQIGGEYDKQKVGFKNLTLVLVISVAMIYLALLFQFNNAIKPFLVFAAAPYGVVGAIAALWAMNTSFGFMAFLGVASLIGVIVSHVIVLFDFIEEMHAKGEPFEEAVIDAGIIRLRPVLITVGATVLALFPLAAHGGPLWQPLCYAQIGGLTVATLSLC